MVVNPFAICNVCGASVFPITKRDLLLLASIEQVNTCRREAGYRHVALMPVARTVCGSGGRIFIPFFLKKNNPKHFLLMWNVLFDLE